MRLSKLKLNSKLKNFPGWNFWKPFMFALIMFIVGLVLGYLARYLTE